MRYFVGTELGIANTLQRHFDWVSNSLWFEDIPNARDPQKTLVVLGGQDAILNAEVSLFATARSSIFRLLLSVAHQALSWQSWCSRRDLLRPERYSWPTVYYWRACAFDDHELAETCMKCFHLGMWWQGSCVLPFEGRYTYTRIRHARRK